MNSEQLLTFLGPKYSQLTPFKEGGTGKLYQVNFGPGQEKRIAKVDRTPESPRASRHVLRGCNVDNELVAVSQIDNPADHHLMPLLDYVQTKEGTIVIMPFFASQSLEERVDNKPLSEKEFVSVFSQLLEGVSYLHQEEEMFHRDLKPSNILLGKRNGDLEVRITDFGNAIKRSKLKENVLPTAGGHWVMDPLLIGLFTGTNAKYTEQAEMYALGVDMYYALTGKYLFEYDPDQERARVVSNKESLLDLEGKIDRSKHNQELEKALSALPRNLKKYSSVLRKCMTLEEGERYTSISKLQDDFKAVSRQGILQRIGRHPFIALAMATVIGLTGIGAAVGYHHVQKERLEQELVESSKFPVIPQWNGWGNVGIGNSLFKMEVDVSVRGPNSDNYFAKQKYVLAEPGMELNVDTRIRGFPSQKGEPFFGKVYFEGESESKPIGGWMEDFDVSKLFGADFGYTPSYVNVVVPEHYGKGTHNLVVEIYAPSEEELKDRDYYRGIGDVRYTSPGRVLSLQKIPIVIGNPEEDGLSLEMIISSMGVSHLGIKRVTSLGSIENNPQYQLQACLLEEGVCSISRNVYSVNLTDGISDFNEKTLQVVVRDLNQEGRIVLETYYPVKRDSRYEKDKAWTHDWVLSIPGRDFQERIVPYSQLLRLIEDKSQ